MNPTESPSFARQRQRGAILVTSLLLLIVLTVLGVAMMRMTNMQERMAGNTRDVNLGVFSDPAHMLVEAAQPANVDTVMVDGRILKRRGRLTAVDVEQVVEEARAALTAVRKRANWW